jgi:hypothetical protein
LNVTFDPLGNKEKRVSRLTIDKGTDAEQIFILNLFDIATSFSEAVAVRSSSVFPFVNEIEKACHVIDMNFTSIDLPLFHASETILSFSNYGNLQYINNEIYKVELYEYPSMIFVNALYYPNSEILTIDTTKRYLAKTWYRSSSHIPDTYAWNFINIINISNGNLSALIVEDSHEIVHCDSSGISTRLIPSGARILATSETPELVLNYNSSKIRVIGVTWDIENADNPTIIKDTPVSVKNAANNSPKMQKSSSGSGIYTLLNFKTGTVG